MQHYITSPANTKVIPVKNLIPAHRLVKRNIHTIPFNLGPKPHRKIDSKLSLLYIRSRLRIWVDV